jgi:hypothetical protein
MPELAKPTREMTHNCPKHRREVAECLDLGPVGPRLQHKEETARGWSGWTEPTRELTHNCRSPHKVGGAAGLSQRVR